jgi:uncharacterized phage protein gp47/JayE
MSFTTPDQDTISSNILRDISSELPGADTGTDSDYGVRAAATGSAVEGLYEHQSWIVDQIFPDTADSDILALHAQVRGLSYKLATPAGGSVLLNGVPGSPEAPAGLLVLLQDGTQYVTTADAQIGADGTVTVTAQAVVTGSAGNVAAGTALTISSPPPGFVSAGSIVSMVGGTDDETPQELLARLLDLIRNPPAGGNQYDFRRWAMSVSGVTAAYVYPLRRGLGTVDIVITSSGGLPSANTISAVQQYIDSVRPVTAKNALVLAPTIVPIDHNVNISGLTIAVGEPLILSGLQAYFAGLAPGDTYIKSKAEAIVSDIEGITDRQIVAPPANVIPVVDATVVQWCQLGNLTVGSM